MVKAYFQNLFASAANLNRHNILSLVSDQRPKVLLDLGCDDGAWTVTVAERARAHSVEGVEIVEERAQSAKKRGVHTILADLSQPIPLADGAYDLIHSNQVIEHVPDVDVFACEIFRLLRPGGTAVISTENGSSWHNIFASIMGWQTFSLSNMSHLRCGIGNPIALHRHEAVLLKSWTHKVIFNYLGLIEFFEAHGFVDIKVRGAGYYPLPAILGKLDPRHAHFLAIAIRKPE